MKKLILIAAFALFFAGGCFKTTVLNSQGGAPSPLADGKWYHGVIGLVDLSGPMDLNQVCSGGQWTRIELRMSFLNAIVSSILYNIYTPQTVTVYCGGGVAYDTLTDGQGKVIYAKAVQQE